MNLLHTARIRNIIENPEGVDAMQLPLYIYYAKRKHSKNELESPLEFENSYSKAVTDKYQSENASIYLESIAISKIV